MYPPKKNIQMLFFNFNQPPGLAFKKFPFSLFHRERYAQLKGIGDFTPQFFRSAEEAKYPCILKPKLGTFGKDTHVCRSMDEVKRFWVVVSNIFFSPLPGEMIQFD